MCDFCVKFKVIYAYQSDSRTIRSVIILYDDDDDDEEKKIVNKQNMSKRR